jgi:outer membrane lipoprotein LolB
VRPLLVALLLAAVLSACATREPRPAGAWLSERQAWFEAHPDWELIGRIGLSDGERAGSLGLTWRSSGDTQTIHLRTAAGGQQWRLTFSPERAVLQGSDIERLTGSHPDPLVERAVGWPIPVEALAWWVRGLAPPGEASLRFTDDGTLAGVTGPVWTLDYQHFSRVEDILLPTRLEARSADYRVRFFVGEWRVGVEGE